MCKRVEFGPDGATAEGRGRGGIVFAGKDEEAWDGIRGEVSDIRDGSA